MARIRRKKKSTPTTEMSFNVNGVTHNEIINRIANKLNIHPSNINQKLKPYLTSLSNDFRTGGHQTDEWWNCASCGYSSGLCLGEFCCSGSVSDGGNSWSINCKKAIPDVSEWFKPH